MRSREPWEFVLAAEDEYYSVRMKMFGDHNLDEQLSLAMKSPQGLGMSLRILRDAPLETVVRHIPKIFEVAISTHGHVSLARDVLARLDPSVACAAIQPLLEMRLNAPDVDWEDYRRSAELLIRIDQPVLLAGLVIRAKESSDPDILEVAEDFGSIGQHIAG